MIRKNNKGFTLIELLAVLVILAILSLLALSSINGSVKKSKQVKEETSRKQVIDAAEKWSVENSKTFDDKKSETVQVGLDVVFIVDVSGSMKTNNRYVSAATAIEGALETLRTNSLNEIAFVFYSGARNSGNNAYGNNAVSYTYGFTKVSDVGTVSSRTNGSSAYINKGSSQIPIDGGTYTQAAVQKTYELFNTKSNKSGRIPVIILLTDGLPTWGKSYTDNKDFSLIGTSNLGTGAEETSTTMAKIGWYHILTSKLTRDSIKNMYNLDVEPFFYTIGVDVTSKYGEFILNPSPSNLSIINKTSGNEKYLYDIINSKSNYEYVTKSFSGQMSADDLKTYFKNIALEVTEASKVSEVCVPIERLKSEGYLDYKFDLNEFKGGDYPYVLIAYNEATNQYTYSMGTNEQCNGKEVK